MKHTIELEVDVENLSTAEVISLEDTMALLGQKEIVINKKNKMIVSFDFDGTLSEYEVKLIAIKYIENGIEVVILTSRSKEEDNTDIEYVAKEMCINKIIYTNHKDKYLFTDNIDIHYDNDIEEVNNINIFPNKCIGFLYKKFNKNENTI